MSSSVRPRRTSWFGALTLATAFVVAGSGPAMAAAPSPSADPDGPAAVDLPINPTSIVQIEVEATDRQGNGYSAAGFGVIVDATGLILAPANLVAPDANGVAVRYGDWNIAAAVSSITIHATPVAGQAASDTYTGRVLAVDGYLDVAVVGIDPAPSVTFTAVGLSTATRAPGESVVVIDAGPLAPGGFIQPSAYAATIIDQGGDTRVPTDPSWLATDFAPEAISSGGFIITDDSGLIVGLPTLNPAYAPPSALWGWLPSVVGPIVEAARTGADYETPSVVAGTGEETYEFLGWTDAETPCASPGGQTRDTFPQGTTRIAAAFTASGMTEGEDIFNVWWDPVGRTLDAVGEHQWQGDPSGCASTALNAGDQPLPNREYALTVFAGGTLRQIASVRTTVEENAPAGSFNVVGRIVDADTGQPVEFAFITILKPGTDVGTWFNNRDDTQIASSAITEADGTYSTEPPIPPAIYPFVIDAFGYQSVGGNLNLTQGGFLPDIALTSLE